MWTTLYSYHLAHAQCTGAQDWPDFLFIEDLSLLAPLLDLALEGMFEILVEEWYFIEGGAEGVLEFCVGPFEVEYMVVFFW